MTDKSYNLKSFQSPTLLYQPQMTADSDLHLPSSRQSKAQNSQPQECRMQRVSPEHCPGLHEGSGGQALGWCPLLASHWSMPHCRAPSLCFQQSPRALGRRNGVRTCQGGSLPHSTGAPSQLPFPYIPIEGRLAKGTRRNHRTQACHLHW